MFKPQLQSADMVTLKRKNALKQPIWNIIGAAILEGRAQLFPEISSVAS